MILSEFIFLILTLPNPGLTKFFVFCYSAPVILLWLYKIFPRGVMVIERLVPKKRHKVLVHAWRY